MPHPFLIFSQSNYLIQIVDTNSHTEWQTVQIQISWLLQKPTDLDLHCLQSQGISGFSRTRVKLLQAVFVSITLWQKLFCLKWLPPWPCPFPLPLPPKKVLTHFCLDSHLSLHQFYHSFHSSSFSLFSSSYAVAIWYPVQQE